jgi:hypothetical protein
MQAPACRVLGLRAEASPVRRTAVRVVHDFKERKESFRRIDPGSGSDSSGTPGIFPFLSQGRDAGGAASRKISRSCDRRRRKNMRLPRGCCHYAGPRRAKVPTKQTVLAVKPAGHSAGAPVASGPEYFPIRCRQGRGNRLLLHRDHRHELDPFRGTGWGERIENIFPSVNSKFLRRIALLTDSDERSRMYPPCQRGERRRSQKLLSMLLP